MKNILVISPYKIFPPRNGGERRIYLLTKDLAKKYRVIFLGPEYKGPIDLNIKYCGVFKDKRFKKLLNFNLIKDIKFYIKKENPEKIRLELIWQGINMIILKLFNKIEYELDNHNVEFLRYKRQHSLAWPLVYFYELLVCKFATEILCVSELDKKYLIKYFRLDPKRVKVIENPVDYSIFYPNSKYNKEIRNKLNLKNEEHMILFFGQLNYKPNTQAVELIFKEILPRLKTLENFKFKIIICGGGKFKDKNKLNDAKVIFTGFVDRIQDYINASDIVIAPLISGSGTRIKILEAIACNKKVISTSIGAEGIKYNKLLEIEDDWEKFVKKI